MASSFLVPFTLHVKRSEPCELLQDELGPLLSLLRGEGDLLPRTNPAAVRTAPGANTLQHLLDNVAVPPVNLEVERANDGIIDFIASARRSARFEQSYVSLIFQEYCRRKNIEKEREEVLDECRRSRQELVDAELPPDVRASLAALEGEESKGREAVMAAYKAFLDWVDATTPEWLEAVLCRERGRQAKAAAIDAAKRALEDELEQRDSGATTGTEGLATDESLRQRAIAMIEQEQERRLQAQEDQVNMLRNQEDQLRRQIEENRRRREVEKEKQRKDELEYRYRGLVEQESSLQQRLSQYGQARTRREEERRMLLEHIEAEEQLLRRRLEEREVQRKKAEEEKQKMEREHRDELYEHVEAEEELLRQRLQRYEEARAVEAEKAKRRAEEERDELYEHVRAEEEILQRRLEQRRKEEAAEKVRREEEEQDRQRDALLKALAVETSALEERMRHREAEAHRLQRLEYEKREEELRLLVEMEAKQSRRMEEHEKQPQTSPQWHQYHHYHHPPQHHQCQHPPQPPSQPASSNSHTYHDPTLLGPPLQPPSHSSDSTAAAGSPAAYPWGVNAVPPSYLHHTHSYPHPQQLQPQPPTPPHYMPFSFQR
ncbi:hypothetical protein TraAM80_05213 [Trypanosoma rangeli]|uniref:Uncharacterized protein n=1 Tax=Trypanosoma rangeli TaxID=5698 RepID=A0A422NFT2_TRYRA|nr:uncharacterized protein TraAM80_05213 [Trypanosoma rangeli]RNF04299.1 hypothetical protein TraAM80_05213 [Trypanosoma rangeli]|eukprot:RNF04299.1 hypothetical protein TraAM80_05213 [Trypanosoma rangeli]